MTSPPCVNGSQAHAPRTHMLYCFLPHGHNTGMRAWLGTHRGRRTLWLTFWMLAWAKAAVLRSSKWVLQATTQLQQPFMSSASNHGQSLRKLHDRQPQHAPSVQALAQGGCQLPVHIPPSKPGTRHSHALALPPAAHQCACIAGEPEGVGCPGGVLPAADRHPGGPRVCGKCDTGCDTMGSPTTVHHHASSSVAESLLPLVCLRSSAKHLYVQLHKHRCLSARSIPGHTLHRRRACAATAADHSPPQSPRCHHPMPACLHACRPRGRSRTMRCCA